MKLPADRGSIAGFVAAVLVGGGALVYILVEDPFIGHEDGATRMLYEIGTIAFAAFTGGMVGLGIYGAIRGEREGRALSLLVAGFALAFAALVIAVGFDG